jgi:predicted transcriptional regulator
MPLSIWHFFLAAPGSEEKALELEVRRRIYEQIMAVPGIHFRDLQRKSRASTGVLDYHLHYMESRGLIRAAPEGKYTRYYVSGTTTDEDRKIMAALRIGGQRKILMFLLVNGETGVSDIANQVNLSKSTVSFHTKRLLAAGAVSKRNGMCYVENPSKIADLLIKYKASFFDSAVDRFADAWLEMK